MGKGMKNREKKEQNLSKKGLQSIGRQ
jgi:hypothetical protein